MDYTIFRFYNVLGTQWGIEPTNSDGLMHNLMRARETGTFTIFGTDYQESWDGTAVRDYVHVMEICTAIKLAIETPSNSVESLGHGVGHTVREIAETFKRVNKCEFDVVDGDRRAGDVAISVLKTPSLYMPEMYNLDQLLSLNA
jgi:UDP-glucose 4-epimerase